MTKFILLALVVAGLVALMMKYTPNLMVTQAFTVAQYTITWGILACLAVFCLAWKAIK